MRALVVDPEPHVVDLPTPEPADGEALIRVLAVGVCHTDLEILDGYMDFRGVPGHEFVGVVEQSGNEHLRNKRVVGEINCACRHCHYCRQAMPHHCLNRTVLGILGRNGAFAEYLALPESNLHLVPEVIRDDVAVFTEPTAAAFRILDQLDVDTDDRVVVLGDGKLGQLVAQTLSLETRHVVCVGKHRWKLGLLDKLGIATAHVDEPVESGADIVVEATGSPEGLSRALELVRPEGAVVLKTTVADSVPLATGQAVVNEVRLIGSRCGPFRPAIDALALGAVEVRAMITETHGIEECPQALLRARDPDVMKVLVTM